MAFESITLERIPAKGNLYKALRPVETKNGAPGVDGLKARELRKYLKDHPYSLGKSILDGSYRPNPVERRYIPKDNGDKRPLGIPTVKDRMVQPAIAQVLSEEYESVFCYMSYGFRPGRSCRQAVRKAMEYAQFSTPKKSKSVHFSLKNAVLCDRHVCDL